MPTLYIVFPVFNGLKCTINFLNDLLVQTVSNYKIIVCDDGSTDGTYDYIKENYKDVVVLRGTGNLWWTAGINMCIRYVQEVCNDDDYILTINNDVRVPPDYLEKKLLRIEKHPKSIIGSVCVYMSNHNLIESSGFIMNFKKCTAHSLTRRGGGINKIHNGLIEVTHLPGKGVMLPVKVYNDIGLYDDENLPQYHADTDLTLKAYENGYKVFVDFDAIIYSDVNTRNMTIISDEFCFRNIIKTFKGRYTPNNFRIIKYFGIKHFGNRWWIYVTKSYIKTIGGMVYRYFKYVFKKRSIF